jgi:hypothetical protein
MLACTSIRYESLLRLWAPPSIVLSTAHLMTIIFSIGRLLHRESFDHVSNMCSLNEFCPKLVIFGHLIWEWFDV